MNCMTHAQYEELRKEILNITLETLTTVDEAYVRDKSYTYALLDTRKELELGLRVLEGKINEHKRHVEA